MKHLRFALKFLNPIIYALNLMRYLSHLEAYRYAKNYDPYDFTRDFKYF